MDDTWLAIGSAVWFGILTAISPCPLATNIAAVSFIARRVDNPKAAVGMAETLLQEELTTPKIARGGRKAQREKRNAGVSSRSAHEAQ